MMMNIGYACSCIALYLMLLYIFIRQTAMTAEAKQPQLTGEQRV